MSSLAITFPDGNQRSFDAPVTGAAIAANISSSLARKAVAIEINGQVKDLSLPINDNASVKIITRDDDAALELIRHDAAHVMAEAVQSLWPDTQVTIGPAIENGFYYDFARTEPFTPDDLETIEKKMREIIAQNKPFTREVWTRDQAIQFFKSKGETYKVELIEAIPADQELTIYRQGEWLDLCRGPHSPSTGSVGSAFKLTKVAGAYWRGDSKNAMLHRIYGVAFRTEKELDQYLTQLREAEARDHRKLGPAMGLFHQQEEAAGSVFWHDKGYTLWRTLENFIRSRLQQGGYIEVKTPQLVDRTLWEKSGHWEKFGHNMFTANADEDRVLALKPMNCPCHVQIFNQGIKSYRDLPLRMSEFGACHRNEPSGALHGIMRVRAFTQDDAHIFCTNEQIVSESLRYCQLQYDVYRALGFPPEQVIVKLALRPELRAGTDETWDKAENGLREAMRAANLTWVELPGEGAFYGPKIEFHLIDAIGRTWQCGTLQLDFVLPERLDANYIGEDGQKHRPVMLHRALLGSMERFIGILIEHHAGKFPLWLAPTQVVVTTITSEADDYAREVYEQLKQAGLRCEIDLRNEKINYKIREHSLQKIPVIAVVGAKERDSQAVALRRLGGDNQEILPLGTALTALKQEAEMP